MSVAMNTPGRLILRDDDGDGTRLDVEAYADGSVCFATQHDGGPAFARDDLLVMLAWLADACVHRYVPAIDGSTLPKILAAATLDEAAATLAQASAFAARLAILGDAPRDVAYWAAVAGHAAARLAVIVGAADSPEHAGTDADMPVPAW